MSCGCHFFDLACFHRGSPASPYFVERMLFLFIQEERNNVEKQLRYQCRCSFLEVLIYECELIWPIDAPIHTVNGRPNVFLPALILSVCCVVSDIQRANYRPAGAFSKESHGSFFYRLFHFLLNFWTPWHGHRMI